MDLPFHFLCQFFYLNNFNGLVFIFVLSVDLSTCFSQPNVDFSTVVYG